MQEVVLTLKSIISPEENDIIIDEEINNSIMDKLTSKSCEIAMNYDDCSLSNVSNIINIELLIINIINFNYNLVFSPSAH